ncbi:MAG: FkbM family methyltransferase, partial [Dehalococcoidia bacterium]
MPRREKHTDGGSIARGIPEIIEFLVPQFGDEPQHGRMLTAEGRDSVARTIWYSGVTAYESPLPNVVANLAQKSDYYINIGANTGLYPLIAALVNPLLRVDAFEPYPPCLELLKANLNLNNVDSRVKVFCVAVSATH